MVKKSDLKSEPLFFSENRKTFGKISREKRFFLKKSNIFEISQKFSGFFWKFSGKHMFQTKFLKILKFYFGKYCLRKNENTFKTLNGSRVVKKQEIWPQIRTPITLTVTITNPNYPTISHNFHIVAFELATHCLQIKMRFEIWMHEFRLGWDGCLVKG